MKINITSSFLKHTTLAIALVLLGWAPTLHAAAPSPTTNDEALQGLGFAAGKRPEWAEIDEAYTRLNAAAKKLKGSIQKKDQLEGVRLFALYKACYEFLQANYRPGDMGGGVPRAAAPPVPPAGGDPAAAAAEIRRRREEAEAEARRREEELRRAEEAARQEAVRRSAAEAAAAREEVARQARERAAREAAQAAREAEEAEREQAERNRRAREEENARRAREAADRDAEDARKRAQDEEDAAARAAGMGDLRGLAESVGLPNVGSTCFANAMVQCIFASPTLVNYLYQLFSRPDFDTFIDRSFADDPLRKSKQKTVRYFKHVFEGYCSKKVTIKIMHRFTKQLRKAMKFSEGRQEAADEVFSLIFQLLEHLDPRLGTINTNAKYTCDVCSSVINEMSNTYLLLLELPNQTAPIDVQTLLKNYQQDTVQDAKRPCRRCRETREYTLQNTFTMPLPNYLALLTNRVNNDGSSRINTPIVINETVNISAHSYRLVSIGNHIGIDASGGHWTADKRGLNFNPWAVKPFTSIEDSWTHCDDKRVFSQLPNLRRGNADASLLIYERIPDADPAGGIPGAPRGGAGGPATGRAEARDMWRCKICTFNNPNRNSVCEVCGAPRENDDPMRSDVPGAPRGGSGGPADAPHAETWRCLVCTNPGNPITAPACTICKISRIGPDSPEAKFYEAGDLYRTLLAGARDVTRLKAAIAHPEKLKLVEFLKFPPYTVLSEIPTSTIRYRAALFMLKLDPLIVSSELRQTAVDANYTILSRNYPRGYTGVSRLRETIDAAKDVLDGVITRRDAKKRAEEDARRAAESEAQRHRDAAKKPAAPAGGGADEDAVAKRLREIREAEERERAANAYKGDIPAAAIASVNAKMNAMAKDNTNESNQKTALLFLGLLPISNRLNESRGTINYALAKDTIDLLRSSLEDLVAYNTRKVAPPSTLPIDDRSLTKEQTINAGKTCRLGSKTIHFHTIESKFPNFATLSPGEQAAAKKQWNDLTTLIGSTATYFRTAEARFLAGPSEEERRRQEEMDRAEDERRRRG